LTVVPVTLGYELRCARPIPFDMSYCRDLGHGAVTLLVKPDTPSNGMMVTMRGGDLHPVPFEALIDPETNRTRVRRVDLSATYYLVARSYMIRLEKEDFDSPQALAAIAAEARMSPEEFKARYRHVVEDSIVALPPSLARSQVAQVVDDPIESHRGKTSHVIPL
jgi:6-phosphofructokinase 1